MRYRGVSGISRLLEGLMKPAFQKRGFAEHRIVTDWRHIVGDVIARYSAPQKLVFPPERKDQGVLHVEVYDSAFATEIHYLGPLILEKIATYFGYQAVARLAIIQKPLAIEEDENIKPLPSAEAIPEIGQIVQGIEDAEMNHALRELGRHIFSRSDRK